MDTRTIKAQQIVATGRITRVDDTFLVPSQSGGGCYSVYLSDDPSCTCDDYSTRGMACKHIHAARLWVAQGERTISGTAVPQRPAKRKTYAQDWPLYNAAQVNERRHFLSLLGDLCSAIKEPPAKEGRPPIPFRDAIFSAVFKVYSMVSARRFSGSLQEAFDQGHISRMPHFNSVLNVFDNPVVFDILKSLVERSALPLAEIETDFAFDSSGFSSSKFDRWFDIKHGGFQARAVWVKAHIATGVKTNVVTAIEILDKDAGDSPQFPVLVKTTDKGFTIKEASADKAYASEENFQAIADCNAKPFVPFKSNATGGIGGLFEKAYHYFCLNRGEFLRHYHKRSNVESTFSAVKRKFGDSVRSKNDTAMKNEVLAKFVCNNICCLISAWYELGIEPLFAALDGCTNTKEPAQILRFPGA
jgi:transposase